MPMTLESCRQEALKANHVERPFLKFYALRKGFKKVVCEWMDPENSIFVISGVPGFIDARRNTLFVKSIISCEIVK